MDPSPYPERYRKSDHFQNPPALVVSALKQQALTSRDIISFQLAIGKAVPFVKEMSARPNP